jgi:hypothetical protein
MPAVDPMAPTPALAPGYTARAATSKEIRTGADLTRQ